MQCAAKNYLGSWGLLQLKWFVFHALQVSELQSQYLLIGCRAVIWLESGKLFCDLLGLVYFRNVVNRGLLQFMEFAAVLHHQRSQFS